MNVNPNLRMQRALEDIEITATVALSHLSDPKAALRDILANARNALAETTAPESPAAAD